MLETFAWWSLALGLAVTIVSLVILYFVIYLAVRNALRSHSLWVAEEAAISRRSAGEVYKG